MNRDKLPINEPCSADWSAMDGDNQKRFCGQCSKHVHDLSAMTEPQATALLAAEQKPCVRYTCNTDGSIRFKPSRRVFLSRAGMIAGGLVIGGAAAAGVAPLESGESCGKKSLLEKLSDAFWGLFEEEEPVLMGELEAIEPPPEVEPEGDTGLILMGDIAEPVEPEEEPPAPVMGRIAPPPRPE